MNELTTIIKLIVNTLLCSCLTPYNISAPTFVHASNQIVSNKIKIVLNI
jgi:hypothetical protein